VYTGAPSYKEFRFPAEIINHCVWPYHRFPLSLRKIEEMMLRRGAVTALLVWSQNRLMFRGWRRCRPSRCRRHGSTTVDEFMMFTGADRRTVVDPLGYG
jgi:transposase-like protein